MIFQHGVLQPHQDKMLAEPIGLLAVVLVAEQHLQLELVVMAVVEMRILLELLILVVALVEKEVVLAVPHLAVVQE
jgi:hypothetical protein